MKVFADQCTLNLRTWRKRLKTLQSSQDERDNQSSTTPRHPEDFMTAFPLTLPPAHRTLHLDDQESTPPWSSPSAPYSRSSESSSATSDSGLCSPSGSVTSFFSPASDSSSTHSHSRSYSHSNSYSHPNPHSNTNTNTYSHSPPHNNNNNQPRPPSSIGGSSVLGPLPPPASPFSSEGHAAIRAAGKLGIRKQRSLNRNSWSPSAYSGCVSSLAPPPAAVVRTLLVTPPMNVNGNGVGLGPVPASRIVVGPILVGEGLRKA
ncbi:hypothetical protein C0993_002598 [Termitomyces sp. T159_Od127]|nr:hypothetical protein C0993_002598 [Termitomyces sp. T159_Od127]